jgi:hypothetical protein
MRSKLLQYIVHFNLIHNYTCVLDKYNNEVLCRDAPATDLAEIQDIHESIDTGYRIVKERPDIRCISSLNWMDPIRLKPKF